MASDHDIANTLGNFTRAILRRVGRHSVEFVGSGFVLRTEKQLYLITAAHVLDLARSDSPLLLQASNQLVDIIGQARISQFERGKTRYDDKLDVAVVALPRSYIELFERGCFVESVHLDVDYQIVPETAFLAVGYPIAMNRLPAGRKPDGIRPELYMAGCHEASEKYAELGMTREQHLILHFDKKKVVSSEGLNRIAPNLNGMSGSPIWGCTKSNKTMIGAMLTEHHKVSGKYILATHIRQIVSVIGVENLT